MTILYDKNGHAVEVDDYARGLFSTDHVHGMIHKGKFFSFSSEVQSLANNAYHDVILIPTNATHIQFTGFLGGYGHVQIFKGPSYSLGSPNGLITPAQHNDYSAKVSGLTAYGHGAVTVSAAGTEWDGRLPIFAGSGGNAQGASLDFGHERILAAGTVYLIRLHNDSGQAQDSHVHCQFYEPTL